MGRVQTAGEASLARCFLPAFLCAHIFIDLFPDEIDSVRCLDTRQVWYYSQCQPAYIEMLVAMPHIEFLKGISTALEYDSFFDVNKLNFIVFDDQMIDASKDKRIVNLFTRGSHHRNLSVIYIVQNLFHQGKGSRSISLNSHYLVLFKNPRDKLQILTLAKQMYPGQTDFFLNQYEEALKRPFG